MTNVTQSPARQGPPTSQPCCLEIEVAEYVRDIARELAIMCHKHRLKAPAKCLELAAEEAGRLGARTGRT